MLIFLSVIPQKKKDYLVMEFYTAYYPDIQLALNSIPLIIILGNFLIHYLIKEKAKQ